MRSCAVRCQRRRDVLLHDEQGRWRHGRNDTRGFRAAPSSSSQRYGPVSPCRRFHPRLVERGRAGRLRHRRRFAVDMAIGHDMARVFAWLASRSDAEYPDSYRAEIEEIIRVWRPEVWARFIRGRLRIPFRGPFCGSVRSTLAVAGQPMVEAILSFSVVSHEPVHAGPSFGSCWGRKPAAGRFKAASRRVAAGAADLGKADPRPARGPESPACPQARSARSGRPGP